MKNKIKIAFVHSEHGHNDKWIGEGIARFVRSSGQWEMIAWPDVSCESLAFLKQQGCRGAIVNVQTSLKARQLVEVGIPIITY